MHLMTLKVSSKLFHKMGNIFIVGVRLFLLVLIKNSLCGLCPSACLANKALPVKPIVIGTWGFKAAGDAALKVLQQSGSALDATQGILY